MDKLFYYIDKNEQKFLDELFHFLRFPSISTDPKFKSNLIECADWLIDNIKSFGFQNVKKHETKGHPIIYGEWMGAGKDAPTVLIYGHYDVQPPDPLELWTKPPFEPDVRDGYIFARGASDDKGQVFAHVKGIEAHMKTNGNLPVNVKLLIEGEEESGSDNLEIFINENKEMLACDTVVISDTEWFAKGLPSICYSLRGISFIEVTVTGPNRDLHSGTFGGAVDNPAVVLANIISALKDKYGKVTIPGFYDDVLELSDEERAGFYKLPFNPKEYKADLDVDDVYGENGYSTLERTWARPSLDVNGIISGYTGEGAKTVLPSKAMAKISMRLVPNQDTDDISKKAIDYIKSIAPKTVKIEAKALHGGNPVLVPRDSKGVEAAMKALKKAFNVDPVFMREGGSIPIVGDFINKLNAPVVLMGLGLPTDNIHSPDENMKVSNYIGGIKASAAFFEEFSKL